MNITVGDVDEPPGSVGTVTVSAVGSNELLVKWSKAPNTGPHVEYQVQYRVQGETKWTDIVDDAYETRIRNLYSNTTYQVRVRAFNDEGESEWAEGVGTTERAHLTVGFGSPTYTMNEGEEATITVTVTPTADRDVTVTVTLTGSGATLLKTPACLDTGTDEDEDTLAITRGQSSVSFTISGEQHDDAVDGEVTLTLSTNTDGVQA